MINYDAELLVSVMNPEGTSGDLVRAEGVEPSRTFRLYGFSYRLRLSPPWRGAR